MAVRKDLERILDRLRRRGWHVQHGGKHYKLYGPNGQLLHCHKTASDHRALRNLHARLRRHGVDL